MKNGDIYHHFKGTEYYFSSIALPLEGRKNLVYFGAARYHENTHDLDLFQDQSTKVVFIDAAFPHVIYQSEKDYDTDFVYAREVDDFFGYKRKEDGTFVKRFEKK